MRYFSVAGKHDGHLLNAKFLLPYHIVLAKEGPNDGVVSVDSATYGERLDMWEGDHLSLVNFDSRSGAIAGHRAIRRRYGPLVRRLADAGFKLRTRFSNGRGGVLAFRSTQPAG